MKDIGLLAYADDIIMLAKNNDQLKIKTRKRRRGKTYRIRNKYKKY